MKNGKIEEQGPVVWKVHNTIIQWVTQLISPILILWMAIIRWLRYPTPGGGGGGGLRIWKRWGCSSSRLGVLFSDFGLI